MNLTDEELKEVLKRNPDLKVLFSHNEPMPLQSKKGNKYRAERTEYNGVVYDSKKEAKVAQMLDMLLRSKKLQWWCRQPEFVLPGGVIYKPDFIVLYNTGLNVIDVKGFKTKEYRIKKRQVEALYKVKIEEW